VNDAAQGAVEDVPQDVAQTWPSGPGRRAPSSPRHHRRRRLCAARAEMGAQLGSSVAFGSGCGQALPGVPRKAPLCPLGFSEVPRMQPCAGRLDFLTRSQAAQEVATNPK